jgi:EAL domain-containing protein (putative c-di-GMP-specific phosphodiesterase class I)
MALEINVQWPLQSQLLLNARMVEAISRIALKMGIMTIAEHVEDDSVLEKLKEIGVTHAQGYAIHKPEALV